MKVLLLYLILRIYYRIFYCNSIYTIKPTNEIAYLVMRVPINYYIY